MSALTPLITVAVITTATIQYITDIALVAQAMLSTEPTCQHVMVSE